MVKLELTNFGPLRQGVLEPRPFTILVGPNNAGKSVLATALYAAEAATPLSRHKAYGMSQPFFRVRPIRQRDEEKALVEAAQLRALVARTETIDGIEPMPALIDWLRREMDYTLGVYAREVLSQLKRCFSSHLADLRRRGSGSPRNFTVRIDHGDPEWTVEIKWKTGQPKVRVDHDIDVWSLLTQSAAPILLRARNARFKEDEIFLRSLSNVVTPKLFREFPSEIFYLPAARSGILQGHRGLASFMVSRASLVGLEDLEIPKLSGVVTDFIRDLLELDLDFNPEDFKAVAKYLEQEALGGEVVIEGEQPSYPEILYRRGRSSYPLHRTSSMVSELAPVVLMLQHVLEANELLIMEEPESHLHPASQRVLARALVRSVNAGLRVMATTHSDFLLTQINNCIRASAALEGGKNPQMPKEEALDPRLVQTYRCVVTDDGTVVKPVRVLRSEGIPDSEFVAVGEDLYSETIKLHDEIMRSNVSRDEN